MTDTTEIVTTFDSAPVVGERVTYRTVGPWFTATGSGIYDGVRPSEHDGEPCHFFRDGEINGVPQSLHGFPVARVLTDTTAPTVEQTVAAIKREILADIAAGTVPADVATFSALHDHVDANTYGGMCDDLYAALRGDEDDPAQAYVDHCNAATDAVDAWLRAGRPTEACWESTHSHCGAHDAPWQPFADTCDGV